ncbi:MAG: DUF3347 domain-containing protein [Maribacter sp.]|nr:DUF3347 domain-containing protein [Maribacter sp.]
MKKAKIATWIFTMTFVTLTALSCKENKNNQPREVEHGSEMHGAESPHQDDNSVDTSSETTMASSQSLPTVSSILTAYLQLKEALVADDTQSAAKKGEALIVALNNFDNSKFTNEQRSKLNDIVENATIHARDISKASLDLQRDHFKLLSGDLIELVAITGSPITLYQQFCPMYDQGSAWLSASNEIKNPYYGSKMLNCGVVKATIQ